MLILTQWKYTFTTTKTRSIYSTKNNTPLKYKFAKYGKKIFVIPFSIQRPN